MAIVGVSFALATTISKVSVTVPPLPSLAITSIETVPTLAFNGVPLAGFSQALGTVSGTSTSGAGSFSSTCRPTTAKRFRVAR